MKSAIGENVSLVARKMLVEPASTLLAFRIAFWIIVTSIFIRIFSFPRFFKLLTPTNREQKLLDSINVQLNLVRLIDRVLKMDFLLFTPTCWKRASVLYRYLRLDGQESRVVFGVRRSLTGKLDGHAWVEIDDSPIAEDSVDSYAETFCYPPRTAKTQ